MRGKVASHRRTARNERITPAYAGKRCELPKFCPYCKDHPRLCGEKLIWCGVLSVKTGSPPPMRGKVKFKMPLIFIYRITPAYAGKRATMWIPSAFAKDHPRLCGEKAYFSMSSSSLKGSPPPMRGKVVVSIRGTGEGGITPAYAGKSAFQKRSYTHTEGSPPPMRGKVPVCGDVLAGVYGSPPPMRGKVIYLS